MRPAGAHVESFDGRAIVGVPGHGTHAEHLVQRDTAVEDIPACEMKLALEIHRRQYLSMQNGALDVGGVLREYIETAIGIGFALRCPIQTVFETVRAILG